MKYTPQLIQKAKGKPCKICYEYISESEADGQEFIAVKTSRGNYNFVHAKCWNKECKGG